ncbi:DUF58 domain-containing protein [bacterium]|nr:DUF58 domain-containing protein [bacterium]
MSKFTPNSVVLLLLTAFAVGVATYASHPLLVYTAVFLVTTNIVLFTWAQFSMRGLSIRRQHSNLTVATLPTDVEIELTRLGATTRYGTLGFDLHSELTPGKDYTPVAFLEATAGKPVLARYSLTPAKRGCFALGPFYLYGGDPFGFYKCWRKVEEYSEIVVLPRPISFSFTMPASTSYLAQDELETIAVSGNSSEFLGVREYRPGEPLKRVHWRSSARLGKLISRQYELNVAASLSVLVLVDENMLAGTGADTPLEYSLTMSASLAHATLSEKFHFNYLALMGKEHDTLAGSGARFYKELAIHLARLTGHGPVDWEGQGKIIVNYLPASSSLIVFTGELNDETRSRLRQFASHFRNLVVITFDTQSFERSKPSQSTGPSLAFGESYLVFELSYKSDLRVALTQVFAKSNLLAQGLSKASRPSAKEIHQSTAGGSG